MPYGNPTSGNEDNYSDSPDTSAAAPAAEKEDSGGQTALLPKSICPGMKPGDEMVLKITAVHDDQYQVSYAPEESHEAASPESPQGGGDAEMASMMS